MLQVLTLNFLPFFEGRKENLSTYKCQHNMLYIVTFQGEIDLWNIVVLTLTTKIMIANGRGKSSNCVNN